MPNGDPQPHLDDQSRLELLGLVLTPGLGPVRIARLLERFGSAGAVLGASAATLASVPGVGAKTSETAVRSFGEALRSAERELEQAISQGITLIARGELAYPGLLDSIPAPPPILYVKGSLPTSPTVAMVGARSCTAYGVMQSERFASVLAGAGLCIVSGGARGIDTAAHRGAIRGAPTDQPATVAVLGCGLNETYPPENGPLFDEIAERGAVISELPLSTPPDSSNFPARNRIVSGLSLGTLVLEAGERSGALITARLAAEEHGREVMALPGRVDSAASAGCHRLIKSGGALLVSEPSDVMLQLETPARHEHAGTHEARYRGSSPESNDNPVLFVLRSGPTEGLTAEELSEQTGLSPSEVRSAVTLLEVRGFVTRSACGRIRG
ncbi:MAG: DNA-processing protein DprA [Planctomycetota bacterium]